MRISAPCVAARHVIGRLLDLSHVSWRALLVRQLICDSPERGSRHHAAVGGGSADLIGRRL
jgi:hypothetical protein